MVDQHLVDIPRAATVEVAAGSGTGALAPDSLKGDTMAVRSCPKCDLRFELLAEVADHLNRDHGIEVSLPSGADVLGSKISKK